MFFWEGNAYAPCLRAATLKWWGGRHLSVTFEHISENIQSSQAGCRIEARLKSTADEVLQGGVQHSVNGPTP